MKSGDHGMELEDTQLVPHLLDASLMFPDRISPIDSWHRHIPFAFFIMSLMSPRVFVELGTHRGDSYSAFCQAARRFNLEIRCYAVDTWEGDEHAGYYGDEVFNEFASFHEAVYAEFSRLLRMRFDQALKIFSNGEIDLLHIDGLHTYEAVRDDYESWLPKMSDSGVILFHDTNAPEKESFGVGRLFQEVSSGRPHFEFKFGYGLGVLAVGSSVSELMLEFLEWSAANSELAHRIFWVQGSDIELGRLSTIIEHRDRQGHQHKQARSEVKKRDMQLEALLEHRDKLGQELSHARSVIAERDAELQATRSSRVTKKLNK